MKKQLIVLAMISLVMGCKSEVKQGTPDDRSSKISQKTVVYVSNYPLYYFTQRIGGSKVEVRFPGGNAEVPSAWMPSAEQVSAMQGADLILLNGATYEGWLMNVSLPDSLLVDTSLGFATRLLPSGDTFTHSHGEEGAHSHEGVASTTWMDLSLAVKQAETIQQTLARKQPGNRAFFKANYEGLVKDLQELDREFKEIGGAEAFPEPAYSQPAFQYFANAYNLEGPSFDWEANGLLTPDMLHEIGHLKKDLAPGVLIWTQSPPDPTIEQLEQRGIKSIVVNPLDTRPESGDFLTGMHNNLQALRSVLPKN